MNNEIIDYFRPGDKGAELLLLAAALRLLLDKPRPLNSDTTTTPFESHLNRSESIRRIVPHQAYFA